jgi:hypothetical protein
MSTLLSSVGHAPGSCQAAGVFCFPGTFVRTEDPPTDSPEHGDGDAG